MIRHGKDLALLANSVVVKGLEIAAHWVGSELQSKSPLTVNDRVKSAFRVADS